MVITLDEAEYFRQLGYDLANGYDKVGWLKVSENGIQKFKAMTEEEIRKEVKDLKYTNQWSYQVSNAIEIHLEPEHLKPYDFVIKFLELESYVIDGFVDAIYNLIGVGNE